jgi:hypothetical protein
MTKRKEKYIKALSGLGKTKEEIANSLFQLGIKGNPGCPRSCPITKYLGSVNVCLSYINNSIEIWDGYFSFPFWKEELLIDELPDILQPVVNFIISFDMGEFPNLISCSEPIL